MKKHEHDNLLWIIVRLIGTIEMYAFRVSIYSKSQKIHDCFNRIYNRLFNLRWEVLDKIVSNSNKRIYGLDA